MNDTLNVSMVDPIGFFDTNSRKNSNSIRDKLELLKLNENKSIAYMYYSSKTNKTNLQSELDGFYDEVNGRRIRNITLKMAERKKSESDANLELEEHLRLSDLKDMQRCFSRAVDYKFMQASSNEFEYSSFLESKFKESLSLYEFLDCLSELDFYSKYENELERMFQRVDSKNTGYVDWSAISNYFLMYHREKEYSITLKPLPFNSRPKIVHSAHNQLEITVKMLYIETPWRFINVTRRGGIGLWDKNLTLVRKFQITPFTNQTAGTTKSAIMTRSVRSSIWIIDALMLHRVYRLCLATSKRDLRFFNINSEVLQEEFSIYSLPGTVLCMEQHYDRELERVSLFIGESSGYLRVIKFLVPHVSLFNRVFKELKKILEINWNDLNAHKGYIEVHSVKLFDNEPINLLKFNSLNNSIILTNNSNQTVTILDPEFKRKEYIFHLESPCTCFDFNMSLHILVTASKASYIKVWGSYNTDKPISILESYNMSYVISLKIHETVNYLYALSTASIVEVWDLKDETRIQHIELNFRLCGKDIEFSPYAMELYLNKSENNLLIACKDYIAYVAIGENLKLASTVPLTHNSTVTFALYSTVFKLLITTSYDGSVTFWNIANGKKFLNIPKAHAGHEITTMCFDEQERILFTGAINGTITAWNVANGQKIQVFEPIDDSEITSLVFLEKKRTLVSVGSSKKIALYNEVSFDTVVTVPARLPFSKSNEHTDDVLCSDFYANLLATGSYDGEILIWSVDNTKLLFSLKRKNDHVINKDDCSIDNLCFIKNTAYRGINSIVLMSSTSGFVTFWRLSIDKEKRNYGYFYASAFENQSIMTMCLNEDNSLLIVGDTMGYVYVWNIAKSKPTSSSGEFQEPVLVNAWHAHDNAIVCCQHIRERDSSVCNSELVVTTSTDWTCRLWRMDGAYVGAFGQENKWNLNEPHTYQSLVNLEDPGEKIKNLARSVACTERNIDEILNDEKIKSEMKELEAVRIAEESDESFNYLNSLKYLNALRRRSRMDLTGDMRYRPVFNESNLVRVDEDPDKIGASFTRLQIHEVGNFSQEENKKALKKLKASLPSLLKS